MKNLVRMKNHLFIFCTVFAISLINAQVPATIVKGGATDYIVTGNDTLVASQSITLTPLSWIQAGSNFTATVISDPYIAINRSNQNYIYVREYMTAMADSNGIRENKDVLESLVYYDGLGRPKQQIAIKQSPGKNDLVTHVTYDAFGRQTREYLPYEETTQVPGTFRTGDIHAATQSFYKSQYPDDFPFVAAQANPYSETLIENSPLNRTLQQAAPGEVWKLGNGHEIEMAYGANATGEVRHFKVNFAGNDPQAPQLTVATATHYPAGFLYKNTMRDENHTSTGSVPGKDHSTEEFTDKQGRVVLKRTYANEDPHDTYYVYDDYGNLTFVIPPKVITTDGVSTTELNELCYQYVYDRRNRVVEKKIPGKGWEFIVYNSLDQPVLTQDSVQRTLNQWLFTKYDTYGRVAYTGLYTTGGATSRPSVQADAENAALFSPTVSYSSTPQSLGGAQVYYSNDAFPVTGITEVYSINYYDDYNHFDKAGFTIPSGVNGQTVTSQTQGLATATQTKVLGTANDWITALMGYDEKGRVIWNGMYNSFLDTRDETETTLDFPGRITQLVTRHTKGTDPVITTTEKFTYDHIGRPHLHTHQIGSGNEELLADNRYDALGQLTQKNVGNTISSPLQQIAYDYNVRGWLKGINDVNSTTKLFNFAIKYQDGPTPLYNGNISQTQWRTANTDSSLKSYTYTYDALNRITGATHSDPNYNLGLVQYDKMGNITKLTRNGHRDVSASSFGLMDDLTYSYQGNRLQAVDDAIAASAVTGFRDGAEATTEYFYDGNGNMTRDDNKGITNISYNHLNLPTQVSFANGNIQYTYDASGAKLRKTVAESGNTTTTDYLGGYIYENGQLQFFGTSEGYVYKDGGGQFRYVYQYRDHLENIRVSYTDGNGDGAITQDELIEENTYYPFGLLVRGVNDGIGALGNSVAQRWKFGGKELQDELNLQWYDITARNYDPALGRWFVIDALADEPEQISRSPYQYAWNNPIFYNDPDGNCPSCLKFLKGLANEGVNLVKGVALNAKASTVDVYNRVKTVTTPLLEGDIEGAKEAYINDVYVNSGAKEIVETTKAAIDGDSEAQGSLTGKVIIALTTRKFAKGSKSKAASATSQDGIIYRVPGEATSSGKPYIGRTKQGSAQKRGRGANDGRDRSRATTVDRYSSSNGKEGSYKEQKAINAEGGVQNLDNKRNEMSRENFKKEEKRQNNGTRR